MRRHALFGLVLGALTLGNAALAQTFCRQALALGLDVSASVDEAEYRLQINGLVAALGDEEVTAALLATPGAPVRLAVYEWSTPGAERLILGWTDISDAAALEQVQRDLLSTQRADLGSSTGLGPAMQFGFALLQQQPDCWVRTLDISGDGKGNTGIRPQDVDTPSQVIVNGLTIGVDDGNRGHERNLQIGELTAYYTSFVIRGPDAFVETALGFHDFENAMRRKLLRELTVQVVGLLQ